MILEHKKMIGDTWKMSKTIWIFFSFYIFSWIWWWFCVRPVLYVLFIISAFIGFIVKFFSQIFPFITLFVYPFLSNINPTDSCVNPILSYRPRRWRSGLERSPHNRKVGCWNLWRDIPKSQKSQIYCQTLDSGCESYGSSKITIKNRCPVPQ